MLILLPPSETKRPAGHPKPLALAKLALTQLTPQREAAIDALVAVSADEDTAAKVLKLSVKQRGEIGNNARLRESPTLPAVDRYTGVLYDALDAASLDAAPRRWLGAHVLIHSAPFGPVGALDAIPTYRLGATASLPGLAPLRRHWADAVSEALAAASPRFILDLRSEAYVALGPVPTSVASAYVRVVTETEGGAVRALNHFNKSAKGRLVRALSLSAPRISSRGALLRWADAEGWRMREGAHGEVELVVSPSPPGTLPK